MGEREFMQLSPEELEEFKLEAFELLDHAEKSLLAIDTGAEFSKEYDAIFRAFHNLKGSAGMLELHRLQSHMHQMETILVQQKTNASLPHNLIDYFLKGCDSARGMFTPDDSAQPTPEAQTILESQPDPVKVEPIQHLVEVIDPEKTGPFEIDLFLQYLPDLEDHYRLQGMESERLELRKRISHLLHHRKSA